MKFKITRIPVIVFAAILLQQCDDSLVHEEPPREGVYSRFEYPLQIGTLSKYSHVVYFSNIGPGPIMTRTTNGIHQWLVSRMDVVGQDSIYTCIATTWDSVNTGDTIYVDTSSSYFEIRVTPHSIISAWPTYWPTDPALHVIPRQIADIVTPIEIYIGSARATYWSGVGLWEYSYLSTSSRGSRSERLQLFEVVK